jgi:hypothetical protein
MWNVRKEIPAMLTQEELQLEPVIDPASKDSKKDRILELYAQGVTEIDRIAVELETRPSYVANVLQDAGLLRGYFDLYTTTNREQNAYSRFFRGVLSFKSVAAARDSVARLDRLYRHFERIGDRAGQHHAEVLALTGRNRARWSGKKDEAAVFMDWLVNHG